MGGECDLVDTVGRLGEKPYSEQATEVPKAQEYAQITHDRHVCKSHTVGGSPGALPGDPPPEEASLKQ